MTSKNLAYRPLMTGMNRDYIVQATWTAGLYYQSTNGPHDPNRQLRDLILVCRWFSTLSFLGINQ